MLGTDLLHRNSRPERIAQQAWDQLISAVESAGDTARSAKKRGGNLSDNTTSLVGSAAGEARYRANAALDALAGRRPSLPWAWLVGAGVVGVALGWAAGTAVRKVVAEPVADIIETDDELIIETKAPVGLDT